jgi:hypothetical protein
MISDTKCGYLGNTSLNTADSFSEPFNVACLDK